MSSDEEKKKDEQGKWTCTPGWCGYVKDKGHEGNRPADAPDEKSKPEDKQDGTWECNAGWCGYDKKQDHEGNRPADSPDEKEKK